MTTYSYRTTQAVRLYDHGYGDGYARGLLGSRGIPILNPDVDPNYRRGYNVGFKYGQDDGRTSRLALYGDD